MLPPGEGQPRAMSRGSVNVSSGQKKKKKKRSRGNGNKRFRQECIAGWMRSTGDDVGLKECGRYCQLVCGRKKVLTGEVTQS